MRDFFISYNRADKQWAEWIGCVLESSGYSVMIQAWDFRPGGNFILDMQRAASETERTIAVLSPTYLTSRYTAPEWAAAIAEDPDARARKLIPVKVKACRPDGLLRAIVYVDLIGLSESAAKQSLLSALNDNPERPTDVPFPGSTDEQSPDPAAALKSFPRTLDQLQVTQAQALQSSYDSLAEQYQPLTESLVTVADNRRHSIEQQLSNLGAQMEEIAGQIDDLHNPAIGPGQRVRLKDQRRNLRKQRERQFQLDAQIAVAIDFEIEDKLTLRKDRTIAEIEKVLLAITDIENGHG